MALIPGDLTSQTAFVFIVFILFIALAYKLFKLAFSAAVVAAAGFSFPWINQYLNLGLPVLADIQTSLYFAGIALAIFLLYEFSHYVIAFFKLVTWPVRSYFKGKEKARMKRLEKEVEKLEKK